MELRKPFNGSLKRYWRRKNYRRLHAAIADERKLQVATLGGPNPRRKSWRIRITPKLRWKMVVASPMKLLTKLKHSYISLMFNLAGSVGSLSSSNAFGSKRIPKARQVSMIYSTEEVENRLVYEIYLALKASRDLPAPA